MRLIRKINHRGDTIVEVMVVLAILGFAISICYATASNSLNKSTNAEEHSQALGILNNQVELLHAAFSQNITSTQFTSTTSDFCFNNPGDLSNMTQIMSAGAPAKVPSSPTNDTYTEYNGCNSGQYYYSIDYNPGNAGGSPPTDPYYDIRVRWAGVGTAEPQQEEITYKINPLAYSDPGFQNPGGGSGPGGGGSGPQTVSINGWPFASCQNTSNPQMCLETNGGQSVYSLGAGNNGFPDFVVGYNLTGLNADPNGYSLIINYSNFRSGALTLPPPAPYTYHIQIFVNGSPVTTVQLPTNPIGAAVTSNSIPLNVTSAPTQISLDWSNGDDYTRGHFKYEANFQLNSLTVTAQ